MSLETDKSNMNLAKTSLEDARDETFRVMEEQVMKRKQKDFEEQVAFKADCLAMSVGYRSWEDLKNDPYSRYEITIERIYTQASIHLVKVLKTEIVGKKIERNPF